MCGFSQEIAEDSTFLWFVKIMGSKTFLFRVLGHEKLIWLIRIIILWQFAPFCSKS